MPPPSLLALFPLTVLLVSVNAEEVADAAATVCAVPTYRAVD